MSDEKPPLIVQFPTVTRTPDAAAASIHVSPKVNGTCPECGKAELELTPTGDVFCTAPRCPDPLALTTILRNYVEHDHIVKLTSYDYAIEHPMRERKLGRMFDCALTKFMSTTQFAPAKPGMHRVKEVNGEFTWEAI